MLKCLRWFAAQISAPPHSATQKSRARATQGRPPPNPPPPTEAPHHSHQATFVGKMWANPVGWTFDGPQALMNQSRPAALRMTCPRVPSPLRPPPWFPRQEYQFQKETRERGEKNIRRLDQIVPFDFIFWALKRKWILFLRKMKSARSARGLARKMRWDL